METPAPENAGPESTGPKTKHVVLIGGGHAHALVLGAWAKNPPAGARLTVINIAPRAPYTGMLPGFISGHYSRSELDYDVVSLARAAGAHLVLGKVTGLDRDAKTIDVEDQQPIAYDLCSINVGITSTIPTLPGFTEYAVPAKPLGPLASRWTEFVESWTSKTAGPRVVVIGGGVGGCELAMAMSFRLRQVHHAPVVTVVDRSAVLAEVGTVARRELLDEMSDLGIEIREHATVESIHKDRVVVTAHDGQAELPVDFVVGAAGARAYPWLAQLGLATTNGFVDVKETLQTTTDPNVFAVGDCAHLTFAPRPKAGVFAVRQAPVLFSNINALIRGDQLVAFDPQQDYLKLISLGRKSAGANKFGRFTKGATIWRLKDRIDTRFMRSLDVPEATPSPEGSVRAIAETSSVENPRRSLVLGEPAPHITGRFANGRPWSIEDHRGRHLVLVFHRHLH